MDLGNLVARNAFNVPEKEGVVCEERRCTWKEANAHVNRIANALLTAGLHKGDKVALWMVNSDYFIYSKEVEDALHEHPAINEAVIIGTPHPDWGETVMAVVALHQQKTLTIEELRQFLANRIADYNIPRFLEIVDALPRNVSGKVLKYRLRNLYGSGPASPGPGQTPS